jgi:hypothetical protein
MLDEDQEHALTYEKQTGRWTFTGDAPTYLLSQAKAEIFRQVASTPMTFIKNNKRFIPNYGERYRYGERISTGFRKNRTSFTDIEQPYPGEI